jgi:glycerol-3-phosphate acyltransferase PlsX
MLPVAVDAMGGDKAPGEIVAGAQRAVAELGVEVVLVGQPEVLAPIAGDLEVIPASEVIPMSADPGSSVRRMKDSSLVRAAEAVRDGKASAMISAGNTGATMASALLRMGRIKGVARPAIATPIPVPGSSPTILLDAGANAECQPEWLLQFAQMGVVFARTRYAIEHPRVGLLSIGEEASKGTPLVKDTNALLVESDALRAAGGTFIGNVEGRDVMTPDVDVVVTDGFTGNVVLKTMEGTATFLMGEVRSAVRSTTLGRLGGLLVRPPLRRMRDRIDPEVYGGAVLLGVRGLAVIGHGNSSGEAVANALRVAARGIRSRLVEDFGAALALEGAERSPAA